jgi:hypothetical protein
MMRRAASRALTIAASSSSSRRSRSSEKKLCARSSVSGTATPSNHSLRRARISSEYSRGCLKKGRQIAHATKTASSNRAGASRSVARSRVIVDRTMSRCWLTASGSRSKTSCSSRICRKTSIERIATPLVVTRRERCSEQSTPRRSPAQRADRPRKRPQDDSRRHSQSDECG